MVTMTIQKVQQIRWMTKHHYVRMQTAADLFCVSNSSSEISCVRGSLAFLNTSSGLNHQYSYNKLCSDGVLSSVHRLRQGRWNFCEGNAFVWLLNWSMRIELLFIFLLSFIPCIKKSKWTDESTMEMKAQIFITDWWLSPELYLKRPVNPEKDIKYRLDYVLQHAAIRGVKVF